VVSSTVIRDGASRFWSRAAAGSPRGSTAWIGISSPEAKHEVLAGGALGFYGLG
jgi:hypothetical protein